MSVHHLLQVEYEVSDVNNDTIEVYLQDMGGKDLTSWANALIKEDFNEDGKKVRIMVASFRPSNNLLAGNY